MIRVQNKLQGTTDYKVMKVTKQNMLSDIKYIYRYYFNYFQKSLMLWHIQLILVTNIII